MIAQRKSEETRKKSNFPKIIFGDYQTVQTSQTEHKGNTGHPETKSCQTENEETSKTKFSGEQQSEDEIWVSRVDPAKTIQEDRRHNKATATMTKSTSLEASQELVTEGLVATLEKATNTTEAEEDTPLISKKNSNVYWEYALSPLPQKKIATSTDSIILLKKGIWRPLKRRMDKNGTTFGTGCMSERIAY